MARDRRVARLAKVTSTSPFRVTFHDASTAVALPRLASYDPALDDMVLVVGESSVVVGAVVPADATAAQDVPTGSF
jgi:hypothetical protein